MLWYLLKLAVVLPLIAGLGIGPHAMGDAYCQVCPARIATTLLTADTEQMAVPVSGDWAAFGFAAFRDALFGFVVVAALAVRRPKAALFIVGSTVALTAPLAYAAAGVMTRYERLAVAVGRAAERVDGAGPAGMEDL